MKKRSSPAVVDEEEMAAMAPSPPPAAGDDEPAVMERQYKKPCWTTTTATSNGGLGLVVIVGTLVCPAFLLGTRWIDHDAAAPATGMGSFSSWRGRAPGCTRSSSAPLIPIPFSCSNGTSTPTTLCRRRAPLSSSSSSSGKQKQYAPGFPPAWCPDYFRHIHTDLQPWRSGGGITREAVERARPHAYFRLVVSGGRAYVEKYRDSFQTRDVFTQWGILQLLARYPGRVPDVDIMFSTGDMPELRALDFDHPDDPPSSWPALFRYCKGETMDLAVVWPDWSFWGWPETNIRPWAPLMEDIVRENARLRWPDREPYAFWKGDPGSSTARKDLLQCSNHSAAAVASRNARLYKIYVEGQSWSASEKYILACDSPVLAIDTTFRDFFSRGLVAGKHYWPIDPANKCRAIDSAVDWGNAHPVRARRMGEEGSGFAREEMDMEHVYEYMLHVLTQYAALLRYKPTVPENAVELCPESMACGRSDRQREFMLESRERYVARYEPCTLPPPFTAQEASDMAAREQDVRSQVVNMEGR
uniref:Uncharacterized protein n=1 Tax=Avena sativa TaxID=4498 RepID=A0ACD5ZP19_AVESA